MLLILTYTIALCGILLHPATAAPPAAVSLQAALNEALIVAAAKGNAPLVKRLLVAGANVNTRRGPDARSAMSMTPLMCAACGIHIGDDNQQRLDTVQMLLAHGANINAFSDGGFAPLTWAVWAGNVRVVRLLIQRGADVNANYPDDQVTPLAVAARSGYPRIARLLRHAGAKKSPPPPIPAG